MGGENGHPLPQQSGWCFVEVSISGQRRMCFWSALSHILFLLKWVALVFKEPGPVTFASGGVGTDFTRRATKNGRVLLFLHRRLALDRIRCRATVRDLNEVLLF